MKKILLVLALFLSFIISVQAQFTQNFDGGLSMPSGWSAVNSGSAAGWGVVGAGTSAHSPSNVIRLAASSTVAHNDLLVTPRINVANGVTNRFSFWVRHNGSYSGSLEIKISTTTNAVGSFVNFQSVSFYGYWKLVMVDLSAYAGQSVYLGLFKAGTASNDIYIDDVSNDRFIPASLSDCHGIYNLTTQAPALLNGQAPNNYTITYYTDLSSANQGSSPLPNPETLDIYSNDQIVIYARIYNNVTSTFTVNYFYLISGKVSFSFFVDGANVHTNVFTGGSVEPYNLQWYNEYGIIPGQTNPDFYGFWSNESYLVYTNTATGCTVTSPRVYRMHLNFDDITVNLASGAVTITQESVLTNDITPATPYASQWGDWPAGITMNDNGTINVLPNTPAGTYILQYEVLCSDTVNHIDYRGISQVTLVIPAGANGIRMNAFLDTNSNGIQDASEPDFSYGTFHYQMNAGTTHHVNTSSGEYFLLENNPSNVYNLTYSLDSATNYCGAQYTLPTSSYTNISVAAGSGITTYNFPIRVTPCADLSVYLLPSGRLPRPGFQYVTTIFYENTSNQIIASGTITFAKNNVSTITNISQSGTVANANGFTYNFSGLLPNERRYIDVTMLVPTIPTVSLGQNLTHSVTISPTDVNPSDNSDSLTLSIVGSYDPNDIVESHGDKILHSTFASNEYLTYTIQFENTGTANAENIRVNNVLDAKLDETTVRMVNASHGYSLDRVGNNLNWNFNAIELVPSGKGYINYQVKPKAGYAVGDVIPNTASIFFDFNPAIVTNTWNTEFVNALSVDEFDAANFRMYPNPTSALVTITFKNTGNTIDSLNVVDVLGKIVMSKAVDQSSSVTVDLSSLTSGMYFLKLSSGTNEKTMKIVKE